MMWSAWSHDIPNHHYESEILRSAVALLQRILRRINSRKLGDMLFEHGELQANN